MSYNKENEYLVSVVIPKTHVATLDKTRHKEQSCGHWSIIKRLVTSDVNRYYKQDKHTKLNWIIPLYYFIEYIEL